MKKPAIVALAAVLGLGGALGAQTITPAKAKALLETDKSAVLLDVRTLQEFADGHISGAVLLPYTDIDAASAAKAIPAKDTVVVVYCRSGRRSAIAATSLRNLGYKTVWDLGGIIDWPYGVVK